MAFEVVLPESASKVTLMAAAVSGKYIFSRATLVP
jgi:hypothetical protein